MTVADSFGLVDKGSAFRFLLVRFVAGGEEMGREPNAVKLRKKFHMTESLEPFCLERVELVSGGNIKPLVEKVISQPETLAPQSKPQEMSTKSRRAKSGYNMTAVRRSDRIKRAAVTLMHTSNHGTEPSVEDLTVGEIGKYEPDPEIQKALQEPAANSSRNSLEERVEYILQRLEVHEKIIESLQSKVDENIGSHETPSSASISYRSMYIDSQKKLEALTDENKQLFGKLENALGKVEVLEKESHILVEALEKMKDYVVISNLSKTTEAAVNASTEAIRNACAVSAKRKKRESGSD